ncbi:methionyl-tRNA formyltransferase [Laceyella putida]|uniref:Methionyl-tRNA formyltransferase n=1 Tax=Laceyella putida TaxID=110101 RepID=A0ABW2RN63_9BACL
MGTPDFAVPSLRALVEEGYDVVGVVTQPDRPKGRKRELTPPPVKVAAQQFGIPVYQPEKLRDPAALEEVLSLEPDLIVTAAYGQILPERILQAPRHGCINVHASLLPKYRGGAPIHWALINGEKETGVTIMYMVKALDAGDMIAKRAIPVTPEDHVGTMHDKLSRLGADLLKEILPALLRGQVEAEPQEESEATFAPNIKREDERIDWNRSAEALACQVRGLCPWPVAFTTWKGKPFKIWWAIATDERADAAPGTVTKLDEQGIVVATGEGSLILKEVQPAGKKRMPVSEFVRGRQMEAGERLGDA